MPVAKTVPVEIPVWRFNGHKDAMMFDFIKFDEWHGWDGVGDGDGEAVLNITNPGISTDTLVAKVGFYISQDAQTGKVYPIDPDFFENSYELTGSDDDGHMWAAKKSGYREFWEYKGTRDWLMPRWVNFFEWFGNDNSLVIPTNEGQSRACPGEHVILRGVGGEVYPIDMKTFRARYKVAYLRSAVVFVLDRLQALTNFLLDRVL